MTKIRDLMSKDIVCVDKNASIVEAARLMRDEDIGDVIVLDNGRAHGMLTDRDIVVRALADRKSPDNTRCGDICSTNLRTLSPEDPIDQAVQMMRDNAIRRLPVVEKGVPVGFVSIGDLAMARDPQSVLGQVSAAPGNNLNRDTTNAK